MHLGGGSGYQWIVEPKGAQGHCCVSWLVEWMSSSKLDRPKYESAKQNSSFLRFQ